MFRAKEKKRKHLLFFYLDHYEKIFFCRMSKIFRKECFQYIGKFFQTVMSSNSHILSYGYAVRISKILLHLKVRWDSHTRSIYTQVFIYFKTVFWTSVSMYIKTNNALTYYNLQVENHCSAQLFLNPINYLDNEQCSFDAESNIYMYSHRE